MLWNFRSQSARQRLGRRYANAGSAAEHRTSNWFLHRYLVQHSGRRVQAFRYFQAFQAHTALQTKRNHYTDIVANTAAVRQAEAKVEILKARR